MKMLQAYVDSFNPEAYLKEKLWKLHTYLQENNRKTLIVGVSGGIDSAVVLGILLELVKVFPDEGYEVIPVIAPIHNSEGTTGQQEAANAAHLVCNQFECTPEYISLSDVANEVHFWLDADTPYLKQQVDYWLRPMCFYNMAMQFENSILVSTTNYSEFITGWFSQYLDILGVHPIIDIRKGQVYDLARHLGVPVSIIEADPVGGLASGKTDEELLGFTYAELDGYLSAADQPHGETLSTITAAIENSAFKRFRFNPDFIHAVSIFYKIY